MKNLLPILIMATLFLFGCSSGKPTDANKIESLYKAFITKSEGGKLLYDKIIDIQHFTKINGSDKDANTYVAEVTFDRVFKIGSNDIDNVFTKEQLNKTFSSDNIFKNVQRLELISSRDVSTAPPSIFNSVYARFKAGDHIDSCSKFSVEIVKTDNGWVVNQAICSRPTESQLANMYQAYGNGLNNSGFQRFELKNFTKVNEIEVNDKTYIAEVKFDRIYKIGLNDLRDKISPEQFEKEAARGNFNAGDKQASPQLKFQMSKTTEGWAISQIGF